MPVLLAEPEQGWAGRREVMLDDGAFALLVSRAKCAIDLAVWTDLDTPGVWSALQPLLDALPQLHIELGCHPTLTIGAECVQGTTTAETTVFAVGKREIKVPGEWFQLLAFFSGIMCMHDC